MTDEEIRFFAKTVEDNGCLIWTACRMGDGYGGFQVNRKITGAHRVAWRLAHGPIPNGFEINHKCRRRLCVNVEHLELLTRAQHIETDRDIQRSVGKWAGRKGGLGNRKDPLPEGVTRQNSKSNPFRAQIRLPHLNTTRHIGSFPTPEAAHVAYLQEREKLK